MQHTYSCASVCRWAMMCLDVQKSETACFFLVGLLISASSAGEPIVCHLLFGTACMGTHAYLKVIV
jgi:hypothetical protein